ncbi:hypothetical protein GGR51DRAFT_96311 [Nemania sp. FL0031]|nr:hypothetical protein GGR51DRAFT_96311 [Nemania sp. FL0031]
MCMPQTQANATEKTRKTGSRRKMDETSTATRVLGARKPKRTKAEVIFKEEVAPKAEEALKAAREAEKARAAENRKAHRTPTAIHAAGDRRPKTPSKVETTEAKGSRKTEDVLKKKGTPKAKEPFKATLEAEKTRVVEDRKTTEWRNTITIYGRISSALKGLENKNSDKYVALRRRCEQLEDLDKGLKPESPLSNDSAICLFLEIMYEEGKWKTIDDMQSLLRSITHKLSLRHRDGPYVPGFPQAITILFTEAGRLCTIKASRDLWHYHPDLQKWSENSRNARLEKDKQECEPSVVAHFEELTTQGENMFLEVQKRIEDEKIEDEKARAQLFAKAVIESRLDERRLNKIRLIGGTFKPTGKRKPSRYLCGFRFRVVKSPNEDMEGNSDIEGDMQNNLHRCFGRECCSEVIAWYASNKKREQE